MTDAIKALALALLLAGSEILKSALSASFPNWGSWISVGAAALVLVLYVLADRFAHMARGSRWLRRRLDEPAKFEGFWMSRVIDTAAPFSISKIYYSTEHHCWIHHGYGYGRDAKRIREWKVRSIHFDAKEKEWFFNGNWWDHGAVGENMETARHHGPKDQISFLVVPREVRNSLTSYFFDEARSAGLKPLNGQDAHRSGRAHMTRLSADTLYRIVGRRVDTIEDISASMAREIIIRNGEILNEWHNLRTT